MKDLRLPDFREYGVKDVVPGETQAQDMIELGAYVRDIFTLNKENKNFRIFGPDESMSNRLYHAFEVENRPWNANMYSDDDNLALDGRLLVDRSAWILRFLRSIYPCCRFDGSTACKMVESNKPAFLETANCILELHFDIECMAAGS